MKKRIVSSLLMTLLILGIITTSVSARKAPPPKPFVPPAPPAAGSWSWNSTTVTGSIVPQNTLAASEDADTATLMSDGLHVSGATQICHPFRGGQFGWNAQIQLQNGSSWLPIATTTEWVPDVEGQLMTCANVSVAGTYAIFGGWVRPANWPTCPPANATYYMDLYPGDTCVGNHEILIHGEWVETLPDYMWCCNDKLYFSEGYGPL